MQHAQTAEERSRSVAPQSPIHLFLDDTICHLSSVIFSTPLASTLLTRLLRCFPFPFLFFLPLSRLLSPSLDLLPFHFSSLPISGLLPLSAHFRLLLLCIHSFSFSLLGLLSVVGPRIWNGLPLELRLLPRNSSLALYTSPKTILFSRGWAGSAYE